MWNYIILSRKYCREWMQSIIECVKDWMSTYMFWVVQTFCASEMEHIVPRFYFCMLFKEIYVANVEFILTLYPYRFQKWMLWKTQKLQATFICDGSVMCNIFLVQRAFHVLTLILIMPRLWFHYFEQFTPVNALYIISISI